MTNEELEEVICGLHRRIASTTAGTPLQDDLIKAVGALRIAVNRIAELEAQLPKDGGWISVEDRLPKDGTRNLVTRYDYITDHQFYDLLWFDNGEWWNRQFVGNYAVTHWMPLPEHPKGEQEGER